ncbi:hypothetical protein [Pseudarthrobacter sp. fls2-241-R2A-168]|uniref:hypothetical protein n=1 Tax=Pseudarthrobacter sp. fls2-241-R2A-168 TaxID=3040304 RepID=UPI00255783AA|nr:hypothetical protein [Pseudarthrobacter sp. fls2-241-R2A-168]
MSNDSQSPSAIRRQPPSVEATPGENLEGEAPAEEMRRVNFEVPRSKSVKLKILAARRGQSIREFLTEYIDSFPDE